MGISAAELLKYVIHPTLEYLGVGSEEAEYVLLGTAGARSALGGHLEDHGGLGMFRIASDTHHALWDQFLAFRPELASRVRGLASQHEFLAHPDAELATNLAYSTAIAWCLLAWKVSEIPARTAIEELAAHWQQAYAPANAGKPERPTAALAA